MIIKDEKVTITIDYHEAISIINALTKGVDEFKDDVNERGAKALKRGLEQGFVNGRHVKYNS